VGFLFFIIDLEKISLSQLLLKVMLVAVERLLMAAISVNERDGP
jgi:hypothetical protein